MTKKTKEKTEENGLSEDQKIIGSIMAKGKHYHYNDIKEKYYRTSTGSMILDYELGGGIMPGLHRFIGQTSGGKSKCAQNCLANFLLEGVKGRKGLYIEAEGRFREKDRQRYGVKFVNQAEDWEDGTCLIVQTNVYEFVANLIEQLIKQQGDDVCYFIVVDSIDGLKPQNSFEKTYQESAQVAGGAVIASTLMSRIAIPLTKKGNIAIFISQVRADIKLDPYSANKEVRQTSATGGNALLHYANFIIQFEPRYKSNRIMVDAKKPQSMLNRDLGHYAKAIIKKSDNDKMEYTVEWPICYSKKTGSAVWIEKEIIDILRTFELVNKSGAWFAFSEEIVEALESGGCEMKHQFHGEDNLYKSIEGNQCAIDNLLKFIRENILINAN